jgi:hypothetical protein
MPAAILRRAACGLLLACLTGCGAGLIYTHVTVPLDLNVRDVPAQPETGRSDWKTFKYVVQVDWNSAALVDAARAAGLERIFFADMEILSVFFGVWQQRTATVYGSGP